MLFVLLDGKPHRHEQILYAIYGQGDIPSWDSVRSKFAVGLRKKLHKLGYGICTYYGKSRSLYALADGVPIGATGSCRCKLCKST